MGPGPAQPRHDDPSLPRELLEHPRYRILELLGKGGMGAVYKAEHRLLERIVVLKFIRPDLLDRPDQAQRFERESKLAARLSHPNVVSIYEAERIGNAQFLVMEYVEGEDVGQLLDRRGPLPVAEACEIARQTAVGLEHVRERGLVHRDIKPSNLVLTPDGQVKILDLGLAILRADSKKDSKLTEQGEVIGTVDYTAPEQWQNSHTVDIRADIYSLGCTLYHLLTGRAPFDDDQYSGTLKQMWAHSQVPLPSIRKLRPDVPQELADVLERMLAKKPDDRFAIPAEVAAALLPFCAAIAPGSGLPSRTTAVSAPRTGTTRFSDTAKHALPVSRRASRKFGILAGGAVLLLAAAATAYWLNSKPRTDLSLDSAAAPTIRPTGMPIKVGVLFSQTGSLSIGEKPVIDAVVFAIEEINNSGGLLGRPVVPILEDGMSSPAIFAKRAEKLILEDKVCVVFGCWTSTSRRTVLPIFERNNHLLFFPTSHEGLEQSPNVVYLGAAPNQLVIPVVEYCCRGRDRKRIFLAGTESIYGLAVDAIVRDYVKSFGGEVVGADYPALGSTDVASTVEKIVAAKPNVILNTIPGIGRVAFIAALRKAGVTSAAILQVIFNVSEEELSALNPQDVAGDLAASNYFQTLERPQNRAFIARFQKRFTPNRVVTDPMEAAYSGVHLWATAVRQAGTEDVAVVREAIKGQSFDAPEGEITIDPATQNATKVVRIGRIGETGKISVIFSTENEIPPIPYPPTRTRAVWEAFVEDLHQKWKGQWSNENPTRH